MEIHVLNFKYSYNNPFQKHLIIIQNHKIISLKIKDLLQNHYIQINKPLNHIKIQIIILLYQQNMNKLVQ